MQSAFVVANNKFFLFVIKPSVLAYSSKFMSGLFWLIFSFTTCTLSVWFWNDFTTLI